MLVVNSDGSFQVGWTEALNLSIIGPAGHGKSTLAAALHRLLLPLHYSAPCGLTPPRRHDVWTVDCQKGSRLYRIRDFPRVPYFATRLLQEGVGAGAILVISAAHGPDEEAAIQLGLACDLGLRHLVVFLSHADQIEDPELFRIAADETRALLQRCGWSAAPIPIIRGSAAVALDGSREERERLLELIDAVDRIIPVPEPRQESPFTVKVDNVFRFRRYGTTLFGTLLQGVPWLQTATPRGRQRQTLLQEVELLGPGFSRTVRVKSIATTPIGGNLVSLDDLAAGPERPPQPGDGVRIVLDGVEKEAVLAANLAVLPGSITLVNRVEAVVCVPYDLDFPNMGSLHNGPGVVHHYWDTPAALRLQGGYDRLVAGDAARMEIQFETPVPTPERGFSIDQDGEYVARGVPASPAN